jgi:hypothetical protein
MLRVLKERELHPLWLRQGASTIGDRLVADAARIDATGPR